MSLLTLRTQNLSWQDRTINIELMVAPARTQLLYNKHKSLRNKCNQVAETLDKEKTFYLRSCETEQRLMERRKDWYSNRKNDITMRRNSGSSRRSSQSTQSIKLDGGRLSAPPRLQNELLKRDEVFLTQIGYRELKSAAARVSGGQKEEKKNTIPTNLTDEEKVQSNISKAVGELQISSSNANREISPCPSARSRNSASPGKPHLIRQKSVRFTNIDDLQLQRTLEAVRSPEPCLDDRIQRFLCTQKDFNKGETTTPVLGQDRTVHDKVSVLQGREVRVPSKDRRRMSVHNSLLKLESAFDDFCEDATQEKLHHLVKYATKMKMTVRGLRAGSIIPPINQKSVTLIT